VGVGGNKSWVCGRRKIEQCEAFDRGYHHCHCSLRPVLQEEVP